MCAKQAVSLQTSVCWWDGLPVVQNFLPVSFTLSTVEVSSDQRNDQLAEQPLNP